jgi:hypothetical protein
LPTPGRARRCARHGLAAARAVLGQHDQAAEAERKPGPGAAPAGTQLMSGGFRATARDGFRFTSPGILRPEPGIQVARGYDFGDLAFITTSGGVAAMDAGTTRHRACPLPGAGRGNSRRADGRLPASGVLLAGDVMMPRPGQPSAGEGSPEGLPEALALIGSLRPRLLIQGHPALTEVFTAEAAAGLAAALTQLHGEVPERLCHQRTGYWQPDRRGLQPATAAEHAAALDLLAAGRQEQSAAAAATLIGQGDYALALEIIQPGLLRHPPAPRWPGSAPPHRTASSRRTSSSTRSSSSSTPSSPAPRSARSSSRPAHPGAPLPGKLAQ